MKERPILFSAPMVRAILEGRKTQTRRVMTPQPRVKSYSFGGLALYDCGKHGARFLDSVTCRRRDVYPLCPYGPPGDRLWVRETWASQRNRTPGDGHLFYRADGDKPGKQTAFSYIEREPRWRPSIHMPRWASRIDLEVTGVRVERLQDISEADALAEGVAPEAPDECALAFRRLWESINGPDSWAADPWVWVVEFKRIKP